SRPEMVTARRRPRGAIRRALSLLAATLTQHELPITIFLVFLLLFPNPGSGLALAAIPVLWALRWAQQRHLKVRTPLDIPLLAILIMLLVTLYATAVLSLTWVALCQLLAGIALFYALVNRLRTGNDLLTSGKAVVLVGAGLAILAPLSTNWVTDKVFSLPQVYGHFLMLLPETMHPNVLAGALVMVIPISVGLLLYSPSPERTWMAWLRHKGWIALALGGMVLTLTLTQSRGACQALVAALLVVSTIRFRWMVTLVALLAIASSLVLAKFGPGPIMEALFTTGALGGWEGRQEVWSRAIYMIQDFPYTGIGLGTFSRVAPALYPYFLLGPDADIPHAHNLFLQVAVDLGIPGLLAFLCLFFNGMVMAWQGYRRFRLTEERALAGMALGLLGSLTAIFVHGMVDSVSWGAKPSIIFWVVMALCAVAYRLALEREGESSPSVGGG
ncbi:MAG: O-antigen ligase family protein, partial [Chloroflexota bacterium]|nr:O-antigen ligase family protein [Chloroflexota bacterium]